MSLEESYPCVNGVWYKNGSTLKQTCCPEGNKVGSVTLGNEKYYFCCPNNETIYFSGGDSTCCPSDKHIINGTNEGGSTGFQACCDNATDIAYYEYGTLTVACCPETSTLTKIIGDEHICCPPNQKTWKNPEGKFICCEGTVYEGKYCCKSGEAPVMAVDGTISCKEV